MKPAVFVCLAVMLASGCEQAEKPLVPASAISGDALSTALTPEPAQAREGEVIFADRDGGHCVLCHRVKGLEAEFQGNVGPDLSHVGDRLTAAQIRIRLVDYQRVKPGTLMPSYYRTGDLHQVQSTYQGKTALSALEIEHLVAYLVTLKEDDG